MKRGEMTQQRDNFGYSISCYSTVMELFGIFAWLGFLGFMFFLKTEEKMKAFWLGSLIFINVVSAILFLRGVCCTG